LEEEEPELELGICCSRWGLRSTGMVEEVEKEDEEGDVGDADEGYTMEDGRRRVWSM
jgi:hypothetical protein